MGNHAGGIIFFGFNLSDREFPPESWEQYPKNNQYYWEHVYAAKRDIDPDTVDEHAVGVTVMTHGHYEDPCFSVCIRASMITCNEDPTALTDGTMDIGSKWAEKIRDFCQLMDIPYQEPKWWLASEYG